MKKINFKQPKYIFPLVTFPIVTFLAYQLTSLFSGSTQPKTGVVTDSINMSLPDAENDDMKDKMAEMNNRFSDDDAYTAVDGLGEDKEAKDSTRSGYTEAELENGKLKKLKIWNAVWNKQESISITGIMVVEAVTQEVQN